MRTKKKGEKGNLIKVLNSKISVGLLIFLFLLGVLFAGNVIIKEGSLNIDNNFNSSGVLFVNSTSGKVGIGTSFPAFLLQIINSATALNVSGNLYANSSNVWLTKPITVGNGQNVTIYNSFGTSPSPDSGQITNVNDLYVTDDVEIDGTLYLTGGYSSIVSGDVAENMLTVKGKNSILCQSESSCIAEAYKKDELEYGDVVCVDIQNGQVIKRCEEKNSQFVVGVVSNTSVINMGNNDKYGYPVAVAGIVYAKVSNENGEIKPGDLLVSASKKGYAMRKGDSKGVMVMGTAFDYCDGKQGECKIPVLVSLSYIDDISIELLKRIQAQDMKIQKLKEEIASLKQICAK